MGQLRSCAEADSQSKGVLATTTNVGLVAGVVALISTMLAFWNGATGLLLLLAVQMLISLVDCSRARPPPDVVLLAPP